MFFLNLTGMNGPVKAKTPYELIFGRSFDNEMVKTIFNDKIWTYIPIENR